jgi:hypothetical protein
MGLWMARRWERKTLGGRRWGCADLGVRFYAMGMETLLQHLSSSPSLQKINLAITTASLKRRNERVHRGPTVFESGFSEE